MNARLCLSIGGATLALCAAQPALAGQQMGYETRTYEYAVPVPPAPPAPPAVTYRSQPVVQPVPDEGYYYDTPGADYEVVEQQYAYPAAPAYQPAPYPVADQAPSPYPAASYPAYPAAQPAPQFDREAWLDQCREEYRQNGRRRQDGQIAGGLLGAAAGGVIGHEVAGRGDRLAGSLIGAGVGGLAGLAVGSAVDADGRRRDARDYCEAYLDNYYAQGQVAYQGGYYQQGYYPQGYAYPAAYTYARPMMLVPVMVPVQQRAVVREYVTERVVQQPVYETVVEYHDVPVVRHQRRVHDKRVPVRRERTKRVRVRSIK